jgi:hypothetical protein
MAKPSNIKRKPRTLRKASAALLAGPSHAAKRAASKAPPARASFLLFAPLAVWWRFMGASAELPFRLARCRSPLDLLEAQAHFARQILSVRGD